jgi:plastocyanin
VVQVLGRLFSEQGTALPDWFLTAGGTPIAEGGSSQTVTQVLEPGTYYAFNFEGLQGPPDPKEVLTIDVTGDAGDAELPDAEATVTAEEYSFEAEGLTAGETTLTFENAGQEPHHLIAAPLRPGNTIEDVERFVRTERGRPPVDLEREVQTAALEGGTSQNVTLDFARPGEYALICFIADREGGPPHALKGMISPASVK